MQDNSFWEVTVTIFEPRICASPVLLQYDSVPFATLEGAPYRGMGHLCVFCPKMDWSYHI